MEKNDIILQMETKIERQQQSIRDLTEKLSLQHQQNLKLRQINEERIGKILELQEQNDQLREKIKIQIEQINQHQGQMSIKILKFGKLELRNQKLEDMLQVKDQQLSQLQHQIRLKNQTIEVLCIELQIVKDQLIDSKRCKNAQYCKLKEERQIKDYKIINRVSQNEKQKSVKQSQVKKIDIVPIENVQETILLMFKNGPTYHDQQIYTPQYWQQTLIKDIQKFGGIEKVLQLRLQNCNIAIIPSVMNKLPQLNFLYLNANKIKKIQNLQNLVNLKGLGLSSNDIHVVQGLEKLSNLEMLYLDDNGITVLKNMGNLKKLVTLCIDWQKITNIKQFKKPKNLKIYDQDGVLKSQ